MLQNEAEKEFEQKVEEKKRKMKNLDLSQFQITGTTEEWDTAIGKTKSLNAVSIPSTKEKLEKRKSTVSLHAFVLSFLVILLFLP